MEKRNSMYYSCFLISVSLLLFYCNYSNTNEDLNRSQMCLRTNFSIEMDTIRPNSIGKGAQLINIGFDEKPVYQWVEFLGAFRNNPQSGIYTFCFYNYDGSEPEKMYYIEASGESSCKEIKNMKIQLGYGTANLLLTNDIDSLWLCYINTEPNEGVYYKNNKFLVVSTIVSTDTTTWLYPIIKGPNAFIRIIDEKDGIYTIMIMDETKVYKTLRYKSDCEKDDIDFSIIKYFDARTKNIHLLKNNCILKPC